MNNPMKGFRLETARMIIRPYTKDKTESVWRVISHPMIYPTTYAIPRNYPKNRVGWWFQCIENNYRNGTSYEFGMFDRLTDEYIGNCGIINIFAAHKSGMITYFIDPEKWNRGYATEAARAMLGFAFDILDLNRVGGTCMAINPGSAKVMMKTGMTYEGTARQEIYKDGVYYDIRHFSVLKSEYDALKGQQ